MRFFRELKGLPDQKATNKEYAKGVLLGLQKAVLNITAGAKTTYYPIDKPQLGEDNESDYTNFRQGNFLEDTIHQQLDQYGSFRMSYLGYLTSMSLHFIINLSVLLTQPSTCAKHYLITAAIISLSTFIFIVFYGRRNNVWISRLTNWILYTIILVLILLFLLTMTADNQLSLFARITLVRTISLIPVMTDYNFIGKAILDFLGDIGLGVVAMKWTENVLVKRKGFTKEVYLECGASIVFYFVAAVIQNMQLGNRIATFESFKMLLSHSVEKLILQLKLNGFMKGQPNWWIKKHATRKYAVRPRRSNSADLEKRRIVKAEKEPSPALSEQRIGEPRIGKVDSDLGEAMSETSSRGAPRHTAVNASMNTFEKDEDNKKIPFSTQDIENFLNLVYYTKQCTFEAKLQGSTLHNQNFIKSCNVTKYLISRLLAEHKEEGVKLKAVWDILVENLLDEYECTVAIENLEIPSATNSPDSLVYCRFMTLSYYSDSEQSRCFFCKIERIQNPFTRLGLGMASKKLKPYEPIPELKEKDSNKESSVSPRTVSTNKIDSIITKIKSTLLEQVQNIAVKPPLESKSGSFRVGNPNSSMSMSDIPLPANLNPTGLIRSPSVRAETGEAASQPSSIQKAHLIDTPPNSVQGEKVSAAHSQAPNMKIEEMLSVVVHDMRSPLSCIVGNLELIMFELEKTSHFKLLGPLIKASLNASTLLEVLVSDILDTTRMARGIFKLKEEEMDLEDTCRECIDTVELAAKARRDQVKLLYTGARKIVNDKHRIKQVILNFLSNAIKFTQNGEIRIEIYDSAPIQENENDEFPSSPKNSEETSSLNVKTIKICDNGSGMSPEIISKLFEKYNSNREASSNAIGIGLGLFICKSIIQSLGPEQEIKVESKINMGTTFTFQIYKDVRPFVNQHELGSRAELAQPDAAHIESSSHHTPVNSFRPKKLNDKSERDQFSVYSKEMVADNIFALNNQFPSESRRYIRCKRNWDITWVYAKPKIVSSKHINEQSNALMKVNSLQRSVTGTDRPSEPSNNNAKFNVPGFKRIEPESVMASPDTKLNRILGNDFGEESARKAETLKEFKFDLKQFATPKIDSPAPLSVLIVDDEPLILSLITEFINVTKEDLEIEINCDSAESISEAHRKLYSTHFDLMILDNHLGDGTGLEFATVLHDDQTISQDSKPLVALSTGDTDIDGNLKGPGCPFFEILCKPIKISSFKQLIYNAALAKHKIPAKE